MTVELPRWLHSADETETLKVSTEEELQDALKAGWLIAPPSQTRGQEEYARQQHEAEVLAAAAFGLDPDPGDVHQPPPPKKAKPARA